MKYIVILHNYGGCPTIAMFVDRTCSEESIQEVKTDKEHGLKDALKDLLESLNGKENKYFKWVIHQVIPVAED